MKAVARVGGVLVGTILIVVVLLWVSVADIAVVPKIISDAGPQAKRRFVEFFAATIRNKNTRQ